MANATNHQLPIRTTHNDTHLVSHSCFSQKKINKNNNNITTLKNLYACLFSIKSNRPMKHYCTFFIGATLHCVGIVIASGVGKAYQLYHKLGQSQQLAPRGKILIAPSENGNGLSATFIKDDSAKFDTNEFDNMIKNSALYTVVVIEDGDDKLSSSLASLNLNETPHVSASVPSCSLRRSNLREEISLFISPTGKLQSVSYRPLISPLASKTCSNLQPLSEKPEAIYGREVGHEDSFPFKTTVEFELHRPMPTIPTVLPQSRPPAGLKWYRRNVKNNPNPFLGGSNVDNKGGVPFLDEEAPTGFKAR